MHSDWFNGIQILQGRWQHGEKKWDPVIPADLKRLFVSGKHICPAGHERVKYCSEIKNKPAYHGKDYSKI
jgi:hypothetical protein